MKDQRTKFNNENVKKDPRKYIGANVQLDKGSFGTIVGVNTYENSNKCILVISRDIKSNYNPSTVFNNVKKKDLYIGKTAQQIREHGDSYFGIGKWGISWMSADDIHKLRKYPDRRWTSNNKKKNKAKKKGPQNTITTKGRKGRTHGKANTGGWNESIKVEHNKGTNTRRIKLKKGEKLKAVGFDEKGNFVIDTEEQRSK